MFVASMMHASSQSPVLKDVPDVTCPSDLPTAQKRREVVQFDHPAASIDRKPKRTQPNDGKSNIVIKAQEYTCHTQDSSILYGCNAREMASIDLQGN